MRIRRQTYRDQGVQLLLGALILRLAGSSLSTRYEQRRLEKCIKIDQNMHHSPSKSKRYSPSQNTYEVTDAPVLSLPIVGAVDIEVVVVVEASIADVNSSLCLDVSTTTSVI